jgi:PAS domain-containing protein
LSDYNRNVNRDPRLSAWLVSRRREIDHRLAERRGSGSQAASEEAEALRRFRSYAISSLLRGGSTLPALDGLRAPARRVASLVDAWIESAVELAGADGEAVRRVLEPLGTSFTGALKASSSSRKASGAPRASSRRAVSAAIDRLADAFLAIDTDTLRIVDANPAAGSLLGLPRDRLLEQEALAFVPETAPWPWCSRGRRISKRAPPGQSPGCPPLRSPSARCARLSALALPGLRTASSGVA